MSKPSSLLPIHPEIRRNNRFRLFYEQYVKFEICQFRVVHLAAANAHARTARVRHANDAFRIDTELARARLAEVGVGHVAGLSTAQRRAARAASPRNDEAGAEFLIDAPALLSDKSSSAHRHRRESHNDRW